MKSLALMWPRSVELLLAAWLAVGPFLFGGPTLLKFHDALLGAAILLVSLWSMARPRRLVNLWNLALGIWLIAFPLFVSRSLHSATAQSEMLVGISLAMFAIIPSQSMQPPAGWHAFFERAPEAARAERDAVRKSKAASG